MTIHEQARRQHETNNAKRASRIKAIYGQPTTPASRAAWWLDGACTATRNAVAEYNDPHLRAMWIENARDNIATARARRLSQQTT